MMILKFVIFLIGGCSWINLHILQHTAKIHPPPPQILWLNININRRIYLPWMCHIQFLLKKIVYCLNAVVFFPKSKQIWREKVRGKKVFRIYKICLKEQKTYCWPIFRITMTFKKYVMRLSTKITHTVRMSSCTPSSSKKMPCNIFIAVFVYFLKF